MSSFSKSFQISADFKKISDETFSLPNIGFKKNLETNNYFNSTIQCITNIKIISRYLLFKTEYVKKDSQSEKNNEKIGYYSILKSLIDNLNENSEKINESLKELENYIFLERQFNLSNKDNHNPNKLLKFILDEFNDINLLPEEIYTKFITNCSCEEKLEKAELNIIEFDIMEMTRFFNHNRKLTIYDCFDYYFKSLNDVQNKCEICKKRAWRSIKELPPILIIFINYGLDKNNYFENAYEFEEIIYFKNFNKKYFLSGMITCKNIGTYFELFNTFSRLNENSNYTIYNGSEVRNNLKVTNKLRKQKIDLKDKKQSWPFVLIYIDINVNTGINNSSSFN